MFTAVYTAAVNSPEYGQADHGQTTPAVDQADERGPDPVEQGLPDGDPGEHWTVTQLEQYAADHGIDLAGATRKADVLAAINTHQQDPESPAAGEGQE